MRGNKEHKEYKEDKDFKRGTVLEALPNVMFRIKYDDDEVGIAYLSGKMRIHRIKVLVGDKVSVKIDPYGGKGRIARRF